MILVKINPQLIVILTTVGDFISFKLFFARLQRANEGVAEEIDREKDGHRWSEVKFNRAESSIEVFQWGESWREIRAVAQKG